MAQPFCQTLYAYYILSEIQAREQSLQDLRDIGLASYFRIAQAKDGGKTLDKLFKSRLATMQPAPSADLEKSLAVAQEYIKKQKGLK